MSELNTSEINERLGGVKVTGELLVELGIPPTRREKRAMYWEESLLPNIRAAVSHRVLTGTPAAPPADDLFGE